jgi:superfamily II DNA or RNA helicase
MDQLDVNIKVGNILSGPLIPEPMEVLAVTPLGSSLKIVGRGRKTNQARDIVLNAEQLKLVTIAAEMEPFDGDASKFRIGVEAYRLGLAYEYDPYFSLSIARVDPLPHQLEAVYDYFLTLPRIRFLLADDPGAGKTIMAGLLLKELKARGLVKRTLIVTPANLTFQWQRELRDKFREQFEIVRGDVLRANYGQNPWQEKDQVVTSVSWVSLIEDARESLMRSQWDLVIVDEAHRMSASAGRTTLAFQLGEKLSEMTDHYLLMTATPHKGDPEHFRRFLSLLDKDVYGDVESLREAMRRHEAPFYLRRTKEALVTFPDPETGEVRRLFTKREVHTAAFDLDGEELEFYDGLTRYVEDQSTAAAEDDSARGRAVGFTMALLQRRMASTIYAVRRTLERMRDRRQKILENPEVYRREQIKERLPEDFEELTDEERQEIIGELEDVVASADPEQLRREIAELSKLVDQARPLEEREIESKLQKLKTVLQEQGFFSDPTKKLLIFTEHKDSLDFLAGDGKDKRPLGRLIEWGLSVTQIHGGIKIGDRDTPGSRIYAEREFRETAQILVATEAAGEGINLQFCSQMINYDIPGTRPGLSSASVGFTGTARKKTASFSISLPGIRERGGSCKNSLNVSMRSEGSWEPIRYLTSSARFSRRAVCRISSVKCMSGRSTSMRSRTASLRRLTQNAFVRSPSPRWRASLARSSISRQSLGVRSRRRTGAWYPKPLSSSFGRRRRSPAFSPGALVRTDTSTGSGGSHAFLCSGARHLKAGLVGSGASTPRSSSTRSI